MLNSSPSSRRRLAVIVGLLVVCGGVVALVFWKRTEPTPPKDADVPGAIAANLRGVGHMERGSGEFADAQKAFQEAVELAPNWLAARINLGIAQFNQQQPQDKSVSEHLAGAMKTFADVVERDPDNIHAHYCLGIIQLYLNELAEAYKHFAKVRDLDSNDPHAWLRVGATHPNGPRSPEAIACFEKALQLDPYLNEARYRLAQAIQLKDRQRAEQLYDENERLRDADQFTEVTFKYTEMGKYAEVIGRDPKLGKPGVGPLPTFAPVDGFRVSLPPNVRWATSHDLEPTVRAARERFGATIIAFDYNRDGQPDLLLLSAVVDKGKVRDLLLRNDGGGRFTDQTAAAGLEQPRFSLGAAAGDYDNDGFPDLVVTGVGAQNLWHNQGNGRFEDVSAAAGLVNEKGVCLGCGWVDIDQDCDLDLFVCRYAASADKAGGFAKVAAAGGGAFLVFENTGEARPAPVNAPILPLTSAFKPNAALTNLVGPCAALSVVVSDLDADHDLDLLVLRDAAAPAVLGNDRLLRFHELKPAWANDLVGAWNGALAFVAAHRDRADLFFIQGAGPAAVLLANGRDTIRGQTTAPAMKQASAIDIDLDGWPDVVGIDETGQPILIHNKGDARLTPMQGTFGKESAKAIASFCTDVDGDCYPDLLVWRDDGLTMQRNAGNGNRAVYISPSGRRDKGSNLRTNADGIGVWIVAQAGTHWTATERTTNSAGLGQSLLPTMLGMGPAQRADVVRIRWPDLVIQAEFAAATCVPVRIDETNRKGTSCPILMTWDGERFVFVTDFLGGGALGEMGPDGSIRPPRGEESVKIEASQLRAKDGHYVIKIAEPMDEVLYLDQLRLEVVDHPADVVVYPDERFVFAPPLPTQGLLAFRQRFAPRRVTDQRGNNLTALTEHRDRRAVDNFHHRSWLGYAEDHELLLDFDELPKNDGRWFLVLAGWTEYPYPESMYAATRAGVPLRGPKFERLDGEIWREVCDLGFPAGLDRVMTCALPNSSVQNGRYRIRGNMQVYYDQIYLGLAEPSSQTTKSALVDVAHADLAARGFMKEFLPDGRPPIAYDDAHTEPVAVNKWRGKLTRLGDVTELLTDADDRFVLCGPGDEITVRFDARDVPPLKAGWTRSFVLRTRGYCKDTSTTTVTGAHVGPLPFAAMSNYPDFGATRPPVTDAGKWHTRPAANK